MIGDEGGGTEALLLLPSGSLDSGQVALLCLLLPGSKMSQSFKLAHFDGPQLKRGGKRKEGDI